jgi:hypothetical protein
MFSLINPPKKQSETHLSGFCVKNLEGRGAPRGTGKRKDTALHINLYIKRVVIASISFLFGQPLDDAEAGARNKDPAGSASLEIGALIEFRLKEL